MYSDQKQALTISTISFTICFAVWTIFSIIGVQIKQDLCLNSTQFGLLAGMPILVGSLSRVALGIWTDQYGGRLIFTIIMLAGSISTYLLSYATSYETFLLAAAGVGIAGGSFAVGIAYVSRWFELKQQGTALGIFGMGNVGAAVTKFFAPFVMVSFGWQMVAKTWAASLFIMACIFYIFCKDDPVLLSHQAKGTKPTSFKAALLPLKKLQVWRFSLYYFFVFGGFVSLALWLPIYYIGVYNLDIKSAGMLGAMYSIPGSLFRSYGGVLSDRYGARKVMYWTFIVCIICTFLLSYPSTDYIVHGIKKDIHFNLSMGMYQFMAISFVLGFFMSLGKAAVYKHIPVYYPNHIGSVGGITGLVGGLGGFILPIIFGALNDLTSIWTSCFMFLFLIVSIAFIWMHVSIVMMEKRKYPDLHKHTYFPELDNQ
ncbi:MAG: nitrate/nitrite transporter [Alphaproteobacteria bacterium]